MQPSDLIDERYRVVSRLGEGRMGDVYDVSDINAEAMPYALKLLKDTTLTDAFVEEYHLLRNLGHPAFVCAHTLGLEARQKRLYMLLERVDGVALEEHDGPIESGRLCLTLLSALDHLHGHGLVHGDVAPPNIIVSEGCFRILDLGAAGRIGSGAGSTSGVLAYAAPERLRASPLTVSSDLFSVGVTVFEAIYGHHPFPDYPARVTSNVPPDRRGNTHLLDPVLDRLLAYEPQARFPSADAAWSAASAILADTGENVAWPDWREFPYVLPAMVEKVSGRIMACLNAGKGSFTRIGGPVGGGRTRLCLEVGSALAAKGIPKRRYELVHTHGNESVVSRLLVDLELPTEGTEVTDSAGLARRIARKVLHGLDQKYGPIFLSIDGLEHADPLTRRVFDAVALLLEGLPERYPGIHIAVTDTDGDPMLEPMTSEIVERLIGSLFPNRRVSMTTLGALQDVCHGNPRRTVRALKRALALGLLSADSTAVRLDLSEFLGLELPQTEIEEAQSAIDGLPEDARQALGLLALSKVPLPVSILGPSGKSFGASWVHDGIASWVPSSGEMRLVIASRTHREFALGGCNENLLHEELVSRWEARGDEGLSPRLWHLAKRHPDDAAEEVESHLSELQAGDALALMEVLLSGSWPSSPTVGIQAAHRAAANGRTEVAQTLLNRTLNLGCASVQRAECYLLLGRLEVRLARLAKAKEHFLRGLESKKLPPLVRAKLLEGSSRASVFLGALDEAEAGANEGLGLTEEDSEALSGRFFYTLGLVAWYRGDLDLADTRLKKALILTERGDDRVEAAAVITAQGLVAHRRGQMSIASTYYQEAMQMGEETGDGSRVLTALQNLGVIHHQEGEWKQALDTYQAALAHAQAEEQTGRIMQLCGNLGNLWRYLGELDRAREILTHGLALAERESNRYMEGLLLTNLGEVELMNETFDAAEKYLSKAVTLTVDTESAAEELEARLDLGRLFLEQQKFDNARTELNRALELSAESEQPSFGVRAKALLARSHRESVHGDKSVGGQLIDKALGGIETVTNLDFRWPVFLEACQQAASRDENDEASGYASQVVAIIQELEDAVPADFKTCFREVRERKKALSIAAPLVKAVETLSKESSAVPSSRWMRLLEINKRLTTEKDIRRLLEFIMDSSIVLTQAERGFVLLDSDRSKEGLEVHVARNIDQENIRNTKFKISHSIASRVIEEGEPVLTIDAMEDSRYRDQLSVHDLKLRSVICLPMRMMGKVLGAIYLDNRFQAGAFDVDALAFMENFADQAGIALYNARLVQDLESSKQALEVEREKVEELNEKLSEDLELRTRELEESHRVVIAQQQQLTDRHRYDSLIGNSKPLRHVFGIMDRLLENTIPVLITGESGTGKELVARAIHFNGSRAKRSFVALNCGAIPANLLESELFGHVKGAFTGANQDKKGLFEAADCGTLFLDELGELPLEMQVKLLRVLQDGRFKKVGSTSEIQVDVRIIAATNRQLEAEIAQGRFREDLYYRLSVVPIQLPPLRERPGDIPVLVEHFLKKTREGGIGSVQGITPAALTVLKRYDWPGNVRQLEMVLKNVTLFCDNDELDVRDFQSFPDIVQGGGSGPAANLSGRSLADIERAAIIQALQDNSGNKKKSAEMLGIDRRTLYNKLKAYQIVIEKELHVT